MYSYKYPRPALTVDCVVLGRGEVGIEVLLVQRKNEPFAGAWALPGGFVELEEGLEEAAERELREETGVEGLSLEQLGAYGEPGRDPRERVVTIAYCATAKPGEHSPRADSDARRAAWLPIGELPELAFDHRDILAAALERLRPRLSLGADS